MSNEIKPVYASIKRWARDAKSGPIGVCDARFHNPPAGGIAPLLTIAKKFADDMIAHARQDDPNECCGILAGSDDVVRRQYRITNTVASPVRYLMDPQQQLNAMLDAERNDWDVMAFYHSHTHSAAYPSPTDVRMAQQSGWLGDDVYYILVSLEDKANPHIRAFRIQPNGDIQEQPFTHDA